jgi:branched-chain amino acid transport system ATP-binding protein
MLEVSGIDVAYGPVPVLRDVSLSAEPGEILCILGRNGAGKTTLMKAVMGLLRPSRGRILLDGQVISGLPADRVPGFGIGYVPQGRRLFGALTVAENLALGLMARGRPRSVRDAALARFPRLAERLDQRADTLSGGEQTMLAVARALCLDPSVLLLDEPTEGLQPSMIAAIRAAILALRDEGRTVLMVEQRIDAVLAVADRVAFLDTGRSAGMLDAAAIRADPGLLAERLGV